MIWAAVAISLLDSLAFFAYLVHKKGLDPSLITQASVLGISNYRPGRGLLVLIAGGFIFYAPAGRFLSYLAITQSLLQILILIIFGRRQTQPFVYLVVLAAAASGALLMAPPTNVLLVVIVMLLGEYYLYWWRKNRKQIYDHWVEKVALRIDCRFRASAKELDQKEWRWVLHAATTESIARPAVVRFMERIYFIVFQPAYISTGIMQTASNKPLSDVDSMRAGSKKVAEILKSMPAGLDQSSQLRWFAKHYNGSLGYANYLRMTYPGVEKALKDSPQQ